MNYEELLAFVVHCDLNGVADATFDSDSDADSRDGGADRFELMFTHISACAQYSVRNHRQLTVSVRAVALCYVQ